MKILKNILKIILRKGIPDWANVIHEVPTFPEIIYRHLKDLHLKSYSVMAKSNVDSSLKDMNEIGPFKDYPRLVFVVWKKK